MYYVIDKNGRFIARKVPANIAARICKIHGGTMYRMS